MKANEKTKTTKSELLVYIYISLLTIAKSIGLSSSSKIYILMFALGSLLALFKVLNDKFIKRELFILAIILVISMFTFIFGKETTLLFTSLILICLKNIKINKIIKIMFSIKLVIMLGIIALTYLGIVSNNSVAVWRNGEMVERFSFIYGHANVAHLNLSLIIILWLYLYYDKINIFNIAVIEIINYWFYTLTLSRTGFFVTSFFLIIALLYKNSKVVRKTSNIITKYGFICFFLITILIALLYNKVSFLNVIDNLMTGRLYFNNYFLTNVGIPLLGKESYGNLMIDNGFISLLYNGGLFATIWFTYIATKTTNLLYIKKMNRELLVTFILLAYSLSESFYMNVILNVSILFFTYYIFNTKNEEDNNESNNTYTYIQ